MKILSHQDKTAEQHRRSLESYRRESDGSSGTGGPPHQPALYIGHGGRFEFQTPTVMTVRERIGHQTTATSQTATCRPSNGPILVT